MRFVKTKVAKEKFYGAKEPITIWHVDIDSIFISKLIERKNNSKYLIGYLDVIRPLVLVLPRVCGYAKTFNDENNKLMSFCIDDGKLLKMYKTIWNKIEDLGNIEHALPVYDDRHLKTKITRYGDKFYTNFRGLDVPENGVECR